MPIVDGGAAHDQPHRTRKNIILLVHILVIVQRHHFDAQGVGRNKLTRVQLLD